MVTRFWRSAFVVGCFLLATICQAGTYIDGQAAILASATNNGAIVINIQNATLGVNMNYGYSGYINWTQGANTFSTFCIELNQDVYFNSTYNFQVKNLEDAPNTGPPTGMGSAKANAIRALWAQNYSATMDLAHAAAFQLAIWRIEYDFTDAASLSNLTVANFATDGNFKASVSGAGSSDAIADAVYMLNHLDLNGSMATNLIALSGDNFQDQITQTPEPSSLCLGAFGAILMGAAGYRRRKITAV